MIRLYHGTGSQEIQLEEKMLQDAVWSVTRKNAIQLLKAKRAYRAAELLSSIPFELYKGTNGFGDEFCVLYCGAPSDRYVEIAEQAENHGDSHAYEQIADAVNEIGYYIRFIALDVIADSGLPPVSTPNLEIRSDAVERALADAQRLIHGRGAPSSVDRIHTAFHGYLKAVSAKAKIQAPDNADITTLFSLLRAKHTAMQITGPRADDVLRVARSIAAILDALNPLRNKASTAHPNEEILDEAEAMLVINSVKTLLHYLDAKFR